MNTRDSRSGNVVRIAYHLTQTALPRASHPNRPHHSPLPQVAACVLLMVSLDLSSKAMAAWLLATDQVRQVVDLATVPDHPTVQRTCTKVHMVDGEHLTHRPLTEQDVWTTRRWLLPALASRQDRPASMT